MLVCAMEPGTNSMGVGWDRMPSFILWVSLPSFLSLRFIKGSSASVTTELRCFFLEPEPI